MTTRKTGVTDEINIIKDSTDITGDLGIIQSGGWNIEDPVDRANSVGGGAKTQQLIDGLIIPRCTLSVEVPDWEALKLMGSYDSGAGTITFNESLPTTTWKGQVDSSTVLEITGVKWGSVTVDASRDDLVVLNFDGIGTDFEFTSSTISTSIRSDALANWLDIYYQIGGTTVGSAESISATYERDISAERGIEQTSSGQKRLPTEVIEKIKNISADSTVEITDSQVWKEVHNDTDGLPVVPQDSRSEVDQSFVIDGGGTLSLNSGKFTSEDGEMNNDNEIRTVNTSWEGRDLEVTGL